jgi:hypothetical protein
MMVNSLGMKWENEEQGAKKQKTGKPSLFIPRRHIDGAVFTQQQQQLS